MANQKTTLSNT